MVGNRAESAAVSTGSLVYISPRIAPQTDTIEAWASVPPGAGLRLGQFVRIRIRYEERTNRLVVPKTSVVTNAEGRTVVALVKGNRAVKTPVKVGLHEGDLVEIQGEGIKEGATIVTEGAYGLPDETKIRIIGQQL
jgi:multidrug efflux pump subunit AcrA (membrane-fusion protein)